MSNESLTPRDTPVEQGQPAPEFTLPDQHRNQHTLASLLEAGPLALSFYPFDFTSTCTTEMECLSSDIARFSDRSITAVGISCDSPACHKAFAEAHDLDITLLSDLHRHVCRAYGFYWPEMNVASRGTVVVAPDRRIAWVQARELGDALSTDEILAHVS
ncbi:MAG: redoxin domain-containing protein [Phycisphaerales bacterium JB043]